MIALSKYKVDDSLWEDIIGAVSQQWSSLIFVQFYHWLTPTCYAT